jgi:PAS domain S-box-containing protein
VLKGEVTAYYLLTGLMTSLFATTVIIGLVGYLLAQLSSVQDNNEYLSSIIIKLNQLSQEQRDNDDIYRNLLATTLDGFWMLSVDGRLLDVNHRYCEQSGYSSKELLTMRVIDLEALENVEDNAEHLQKVISEGGNLFESKHRRKDGSLWDVEISATYLDKQGGRIYAFLRDITERKQFEATLREQEFLFHTQFNLGNLGIAITSLEKRWLRVNPKLCQIFGYSEEELIQRTWAEMTYPEDLAADLQQFQRLLAGEIDNYELEKRFIRKDGNTIYTHLTVACYRYQGKPQFVIASLTDISERKRQEAEIRRLSDSELNKAKLEAERASKAKSDFMASMSHELFTPMNAVLGFAQLLECENLTEEQQTYVDAILTGGYKLLDLLKEVLDFSIITSEKLELKQKKLDLAVLIEDCIKLMQSLAAKKGISIIHNFCENCHTPIMADSLRLKQVLLNLISNAINYNQKNGSITLSCECMPHHIKISITDTGQGLSTEQLENLFLPFERLSAKNSAVEGAGLGLCISKNLIEAMNGKIGASSILGEGSCFWIEIPLA